MTSRLEDVWRRCAPDVLAALVRRYGDFDAAEDAVQEALLAAARQWPTGGMPDNPRGWLITVASRRLVDQWRAEQARTDREQLIARHTPPEAFLAATADTLDGGERDDSLTLLLLCCHPALTRPSQVALTLRAVGGLSTTQIARAFLNPCQLRTWVLVGHVGSWRLGLRSWRVRDIPRRSSRGAPLSATLSMVDHTRQHMPKVSGEDR